jgi:hypothetical protein
MNLTLFIMLSIKLKKSCELKILFLTIIFGLISISFVSGFGVSISYSMQDPLRLYSGQSVDVIVVLQSLIDEGNLTVVPEILQGQDIVKITDSSKEYNILSNQPVGAEVHLKVSIPDNIIIGKEYTVKLLFRDITKRQGGMVGVSTSIGASFNVSVIEKPEVIKEEVKISKSIIIAIIVFLIILIIIVIIIIWFLIKRNRRLNMLAENKL